MVIVVPTQKSKVKYIMSQEGYCINSVIQNKGVKLDVVENNTTGLSKLYNEKIRQYKELKEDIVVFMHDDLEIHDHFFYKKLLYAHETNDVVGLAGGESPAYEKTDKALWHIACERNKLHGVVSHLLPNGYNSAFFGLTPHKVDVIDGLFISIKLENIPDDPFDDDFDWHHYDIAFCEKMKNKVSISTQMIFCIHHGLGEWNVPEWHESNKKFYEKYFNRK